MYAAQVTWVIGKETLEETHRRGDDQRRVPILGRVAQPAELEPVFLPVWLRGRHELFVRLTLQLHEASGVVLQNGVPTQRVRVDCGVLLDDREERNHHDDAAKLLRPQGRTTEGEGHRSQSLAAARGYREREESGYAASRFQTVRQYAGAHSLNRAVARSPCQFLHMPEQQTEALLGAQR